MNDAMPSWKSSVACTVAAIAGIAAIAAGSSSSRARRALAIVCTSADGEHCSISRARAIARSICSPGSTTSCTSPMR